MTRRRCWFYMTVGGFGFAVLGIGSLEGAVACSYFSGLGLLLHWSMN